MSCACFQHQLKIEYRYGSGFAFGCGHQWSGAGDAFVGIRRKLTVTDHYENGDVITTWTFAEKIVNSLGDDCDPAEVVSDRDPEFNYGDPVSVDYLFEDPYVPADILSAADSAIASALSAASWTERILSFTGAEDVFLAGHVPTLYLPATGSIHQINTVGDPGSVNWGAEGHQTEVRFTLLGPRLPCRVEVGFSNGDSQSINLTSASPVGVVTAPFNLDTNVGGEALATEVLFSSIRLFFTPFA